MDNLYLVMRQNGNVVVSIMFNRSNGKYHFVNLTKGHICSCAFDSPADAVADMQKLQDNGDIIGFLKMKG